MPYYLVHFIIYNKIYLLTGAILLFLAMLPGKEKISAHTQKIFYLLLIIWIISFAYRINTGQDITYLFNKEDNWGSKSKPVQLEASPFHKYYANEAGRKAQSKNQ